MEALNNNEDYVIHNQTIGQKNIIFNSLKIPIVKSLYNDGYKYMYKNSKCEIDKKLKIFLDTQIKMVSNNFDSVGLITGMEGSAKSTLVITSIMTYICHVLGTTFNEDTICFSLEQLNQQLEKSIEGDVICLDEFVLLGSSDETMTKLQRLLRKKFTLIRKKKLFIFLVIPSIHMLNKYFAVQRTRYCLNCVSIEAKRGFAKLYGYGKKNYLCMNGHKSFTYEGFKYDTEIKFIDLRNKDIVGEDIIDWNIYERKKNEAIQYLAKQEEDTLKVETENESLRAKKRTAQLFTLITKLKETGLKDKELMKIMNSEESNYYNTLKRGKEYKKELLI